MVDRVNERRRWWQVSPASRIALAVAVVLAGAAILVAPWDTLISRRLSQCVDTAPMGIGHELISCVDPFGKATALVFLGVAAALAGYRRQAARLVLALIVTGLLVGPLKAAVGRERPNGSNRRSFPSGDSAAAAAAATTVALAAPGLTPLVGTVALGVGVGRVGEGVHYGTDVLVGWVLGILSGVIAWRLRVSARLTSVLILLAGAAALVSLASFGGIGHPPTEIGRLLTVVGPALAFLVAARRMAAADVAAWKGRSGR